MNVTRGETQEQPSLAKGSWLTRIPLFREKNKEFWRENFPSRNIWGCFGQNRPEDDKSRQLVKKSDFYFTRFRPRPDPTDSLSPSPVMNRELIPRIRREELGAFAQAFG